MNVEEEKYESDYVEPQKSGRSWFAFCGIGCLILLLLCGIGAVIAYFTAGDYIKMAYEQGMMHAQSMQLAMESDAVKAKLGEPITPEGIAFPETIPEGDAIRQVYNVDLKGPDGTGVMHVEYLMEPGKPVTRTKFYVEVDGEEINLLDSAEFDLPDVSDGLDGEEVDEMDMEENGDSVDLEQEETVGAADGN